MTNLVFHEQERFGMPYRNALIPKMCPPLNLSYWHMYLRRRAYTFRASRRSECIEAIIRRKLLQYVEKLRRKLLITNLEFYFLHKLPQLSRSSVADLRISWTELRPSLGPPDFGNASFRKKISALSYVAYANIANKLLGLLGDRFRAYVWNLKFAPVYTGSPLIIPQNLVY